MDVNPSLIYENIKCLCKVSKINISDIEISNGLSKGFFSRKNKGSYKFLSALLNICKTLGTSIDELCFDDLVKANKIIDIKKQIEVLEERKELLEEQKRLLERGE